MRLFCGLMLTIVGSVAAAQGSMPIENCLLVVSKADRTLIGSSQFMRTGSTEDGAKIYDAKVKDHKARVFFNDGKPFTIGMSSLENEQVDARNEIGARAATEKLAQAQLEYQKQEDSRIRMFEERLQRASPDERKSLSQLDPRLPDRKRPFPSHWYEFQPEQKYNGRDEWLYAIEYISGKENSRVGISLEPMISQNHGDDEDRYNAALKAVTDENSMIQFAQKYGVTKSYQNMGAIFSPGEDAAEGTKDFRKLNVMIQCQALF